MATQREIADVYRRVGASARPLGAVVTTASGLSQVPAPILRAFAVHPPSATNSFGPGRRAGAFTRVGKDRRMRALATKATQSATPSGRFLGSRSPKTAPATSAPSTTVMPMAMKRTFSSMMGQSTSWK